MIWNLAQNLVCIVLMACTLAACVQADPIAHSRAVSDSSTNGKFGISQASTIDRLYGDAPEKQSSTQPQPTKIINQKANPITAVKSNPTIAVNDNFWDQLRSNFKLSSYTNNPQVQAQIQYYVQNPKAFNKIITRAAPYMYFIMQQAEQRNLPAELVLLPIMESAYDPSANSNKGAAGLWQLMHITASGYGIKQDSWYDGRRDISASTNGALNYLTHLQSLFSGDWLLTLAAYNAGQGTIKKSMRANDCAGKPKDFWSLPLPSETKSYVPRLLALASIISHPERYSIKLPTIMNKPYLKQVNLGAPVNLAQTARLAGMKLNELKQLNPGYTRTVTGPNSPNKLLFPVEKIAIFKENLATSPGLTTTIWGKYKVQHKDSLASIAKRYKTTVAFLKDTNQLNKTKTPVGTVIMIPTGTQIVKSLPDLA